MANGKVVRNNNVLKNEAGREIQQVDSETEEGSVYDSEDGLQSDNSGDRSASDSDEDADEQSDDADEESDEGDDESDDGFEDQGSSDGDEDRLDEQAEADDYDDELEVRYESTIQAALLSGNKRDVGGSRFPVDARTASWVHTDDLSSDDEDADGKVNRIGKVPIHWYDEYEHIGYNVHGGKVAKSISDSGDRIDQALAHQENRQNGRFIVRDTLNDKDVELTARQLELIRRVQAGAFAHPEHDGNAEYIDYYSGVDPEISGLSSNTYEPKHRFQPSQWEKLQVDRLLDKLKKGAINMDYLTGKIRDMNDSRKQKQDSDKPFALWTGDEEDLLNLRKGPQHIAPPKLPPPGHAASYRPPPEYLPTEDDLEKWKEMSLRDRPHGHMIPKQFPNLRSVGAYEYSVREAFERCLDLYLAPRLLKRRLNIDPESLVPRLPKANDLRPFPTAKCIEYETPYDEDPPIIRCVTASPDGQFMASGASDGYVRLWEVQTGRLLRSWNLFGTIKALASQDQPEDEDKIKPVVSIEWNPNRSHHCLLATIGTFVIVVATGTAGAEDVELNEALMAEAAKGGNVTNPLAAKAVRWIPIEGKQTKKPLSICDTMIGPICALRTNRDVASARWQAKGDYFVSVSPKAGSAAVLIHQLSKGNSQQPFKKAKGESQLACFHPNKPFLFVASQQHVRIYHLVKQTMAKRLISGCRWISSLDVHSSGDHLIVGSLDKRVVWFDLDLSATPYKTLRYHERGVRSCQFHRRYPLMASASDDGAVHIFHSMVYSDLMRNPLIVPVKILRGHTNAHKLGVLTISFHPTQPWIFTGGADGKIILFQDI